MNMPFPMCRFSYNEINSQLLTFYEAAANTSMENPTQEVRNEVNPNATQDDIIYRMCWRHSEKA